MKKLFIIFAVICLAAPAFAADWNFYGSERFDTFSVNKDTDNNAHDSSQTNTQWTSAGNSRIGATVKFNDQIGGGFEVGDSINKRKLFGTYSFGNGAELLLGQTYTPTAMFLSNSVFDGDGDLLGIGEYYDGRLPMIQLTMSGFKIALIDPHTSGNVLNPDLTTAYSSTNATTYHTKVTIPKIEVAYNMKSDQYFFTVFGGYQTYDLNANTSGTNDLTVNSYLVGGGGGMNFGPLFVKLGAHYGQNLGNFGAYNPSGDFAADGNTFYTDTMVVENGKEKDTTCWGAESVIGFNASDMLTVEAGGGYEYAEVDLSNTDGSNIYQVYLNATINIAKGFFIVPEVGYVKSDGETFGASSDPNPSTTYFGAKWQIDF
jgi:hypothetical protein